MPSSASSGAGAVIAVAFPPRSGHAHIEEDDLRQAGLLAVLPDAVDVLDGLGDLAIRIDRGIGIEQADVGRQLQPFAHDLQHVVAALFGSLALDGFGAGDEARP